MRSMAFLVFWKGHDIPNIFRSCQDHHDTVQAHRKPEMGRRPVLQSLNEKAKANSLLLFRVAKDWKIFSWSRLSWIRWEPEAIS